MFEMKPQPTETDTAQSHGLALFSYLLRGHVSGAEVYGMLDRAELELAHHASAVALSHDAEPIAREHVSVVRARILRSVNARIAEHEQGIRELAATHEEHADELQPTTDQPTAEQMIAKFARALVHLAQQNNGNDGRNGGALVPIVRSPKPQPPAGKADDIAF